MYATPGHPTVPVGGMPARRPGPVWGPPHPAPPPPWVAHAPGRGSTAVWNPPVPATVLVCDSCGLRDRGEYCSRCGWEMGTSRTPWRLVAESFFKVGALRRYARFYRTLLRAPVAQTIRGFETGRLADAVRFCEQGVALFVFACAVTHVTQLGAPDGNAVVDALVSACWPFAQWGTTYGLYYLVMRRVAARRRTSREYLHFLCLHLGFVLLPQAVGLFGGVGAVIAVLLLVPVLVYMVRTWSWFWGTSGTRSTLVLLGCSLAGMVVGLVVIVPFAALQVVFSSSF